MIFCFIYVLFVFELLYFIRQLPVLAFHLPYLHLQQLVLLQYTHFVWSDRFMIFLGSPGVVWADVVDWRLAVVCSLPNGGRIIVGDVGQF